LAAAVLAATLPAAALSGLLMAALSGLLALLPGLLLPAAALLLTAVLAALLLLATALATLVGIVHEHSCEVTPPDTGQRVVPRNVPHRQLFVTISFSAPEGGEAGGDMNPACAHAGSRIIRIFSRGAGQHTQ
jgi:hypothetical protein